MPNRYRNISKRKSLDGKVYRGTTIYPEVPLDENDIYVVASYGDRYDILAHEFYKDSQLWWIIASANNYYKGSLSITPGVQLRIPSNKDRVLENFENVNNTR
mgnify:FL=1|tara:strand:- start:939 stop:1244 length:306 start_codon:yes stop_codon:yes gene_type:complete